MRARRAIGVLGAVLLAALALALAATAAPRDSIRLVLPKKLVSTRRETIVLTGYASGKTPLVWLYSQPQKCGSTLAAEDKFNNQTIWITGGHVNGHYRYKDPVGFLTPTKGRQNFCAYLTSFTPTFSYITEAHESVRFKISAG
jgi:hypothetical protein